MSKRNKKKNIGKNVKKTFLDKIKENKKLVEGAGIALVAVVAILLIVVAVNSNPVYGTYEVEELLYLNRLSNVPEEGYEEDYIGVSVSKKELVITYAESEEVIEKPALKKEKNVEELLASWTASIPEEKAGCLNGVENVYFVYDSEDRRTDYALVEKEDGVLFVQYFIVNDSIDIWHIFELDR